MNTVTKEEALAKNPDRSVVADTFPPEWIVMGCETEDCILHIQPKRGLMKLGFYADKEEEAIEKWNRRAESTPVPPVKNPEPRYGMGYEYHDWYCPSCKRLLAYEPDIKGIPSICLCGQKIDRDAVKEGGNQ